MRLIAHPFGIRDNYANMISIDDVNTANLFVILYYYYCVTLIHAYSHCVLCYDDGLWSKATIHILICLGIYYNIVSYE